jgi:hypothetical protein
MATRSLTNALQLHSKRNSTNAIPTPEPLPTRQAKRVRIPKNVRAAVEEGADLHAGSSTASDEFTGPHTLIRRGEVQPEVEAGKPRFVIPYVARIRFGKPRRVGRGS